MKSLQHLCLERLPKATWYNLSSHLQALLITDDMRSSFIKLQRSILHRRRRRMQKLIELLTQQLGVSLVPSDAVRYPAIDAGFEIKPGDHLVVMVGGDNGFGHHGLYLGYNEEEGCPEVADFGSDTGKTDNTIRIISYSKFVHGVDHVYIVPYSKDADVTRQRSIEIAKKLAELKDKAEYNILTWNCETFVLYCKTGGDVADGKMCVSEQVEKFMDAIKEDIRSEESIICKSAMVAGRSSGSKCMIM